MSTHCHFRHVEACGGRSHVGTDGAVTVCMYAHEWGVWMTDSTGYGPVCLVCTVQLNPDPTGLPIEFF